MGNDQRNSRENPLVSWILTIALLATVWPVGLILLFRMLTNGALGKKPRLDRAAPIDVTAREIHDTPTARPAPASATQNGKRSAPQARGDRQTRAASPIRRHWGSGLVVAGVVLMAVGSFSLRSQLSELLFSVDLPVLLRSIAVDTGVLATGLVVLLCGIGRQSRGRRYRRYLSLIGDRESVPVDALAKAIPVSYQRACRDLRDMLERGFLATGYLDNTSRRLILSEAGLRDEAPVEEPEAGPKDQSESERVCAAIRAINDDIDDEEMSRKLDRIEEITGRILDYQSQHPECAGELRSFLDYYLPTTLKILRSYAELEEQGVEGGNITAAKASIEATMDKVVEGFEKQLDKLFQADALDITSDMQVLEQMLQKDGLTGDAPF